MSRTDESSDDRTTTIKTRLGGSIWPLVAGWKPDGSNGSAHREWAQDLWESLAPFALPGGYANLLAPRDREQARDAYGGNGARLASLKRRFDPDGVFAGAIPLPD